MKPRWELGALLTAASFSTTGGQSSSYSAYTSDCSSTFVSDGWCDSSNNISECDYDGGDCCSCDCFDDTFECGVVGFTCIDPTSSCYNHHYDDDDDDFYASSDDSSCYSWSIGDGFCDTSNNNSDCDYDGGDCCSCDCIDDTYECGVVGFTCIDPTSSCYNSHLDDDEDDYDVSPTFGDPSDDGDDGAVAIGSTSNDGDDEVPVGAIVGGTVGGGAVLAAAAVLVCMFVTGRLECSKCCGASSPPAGAAPAGQGSAQAGTKTFPAPAGAAAGASAAPARNMPPPPAYGSSHHGATSTAVPPPSHARPAHQYPQVK